MNSGLSSLHFVYLSKDVVFRRSRMHQELPGFHLCTAWMRYSACSHLLWSACSIDTPMQRGQTTRYSFPRTGTSRIVSMSRIGLKPDILRGIGVKGREIVGEAIRFQPSDKCPQLTRLVASQNCPGS